jgi:hypothetical protein
MNFEKSKEVFSHHRPNKKNLFHIFHICYRLGESNISLDPIFQNFREAENQKRQMAEGSN